MRNIAAFILILFIATSVFSDEKEILIEKMDKYESLYTFYKKNGYYYFDTLHKDGSGATHLLRKQGNKYYDSTSRYGEYYIIKENKVSIYDDQGYIRDL